MDVSSAQAVLILNSSKQIHSLTIQLLHDNPEPTLNQPVDSTARIKFWVSQKGGAGHEQDIS
ncbi:hypothetical protein LC607_33860 [Nostoc sp. CHAB 5824]|nr:hypothetical protein [Nostoc sp. CHAB 5824]